MVRLLECVMGKGICERLSTFIYLFGFNVYLFLKNTQRETETESD